MNDSVGKAGSEPQENNILLFDKSQNRVIHSFSILEVMNIWLAQIIEIGDLLNFHSFLVFRFCNNNEIRFYNDQFYNDIKFLSHVISLVQIFTNKANIKLFDRRSLT